MKLEDRVAKLIAVGASVAANCQPCLQINVAKALEIGVNEEEIAGAIEVGSQVRQGAAARMDRFATSLNQAVAVTADQAAGSCGCGCDTTESI